MKSPYKVAVIGTYDMQPSQLFNVDLMQYLQKAGISPYIVVYRTSQMSEKKRSPKLISVGENQQVIKTYDFNDPDCVQILQLLQPDLLIYAGGLNILHASLLTTARLGCLGGHYGFLPTIRGMATVEWSVIYDIEPTVAIQRMKPGVDTGDIIMQQAVPLKKNDNFKSIKKRSYEITKKMLVQCAKKLLEDNSIGTTQNLAKGKQYYRMHPWVRAIAKKKLADLLAEKDTR